MPINAIAKLGSAALEQSWARSNATQAYHRKLDFWHKQNEYNLPKNQVARLKDAGLNPALMYGAGQGANTAGELSNISPAETPQVGDFDLLGMMKQAAEIRQIESATRLNEAEAERTVGETLLPGTRQRQVEALTSLTESQKLSEDVKRQAQQFQLDMDKVYTSRERDVALKTAIESFDKLCAETVAQMNKNSLFPSERTQLENALAIQGQQIALMRAEEALYRKKTELTHAELIQLQRLLPYLVVQSLQNIVNTKLKNHQIERGITLNKLLIESQEFRNEIMSFQYWNGVTQGWVNTGIKLGSAIATRGISTAFSGGSGANIAQPTGYEPYVPMFND